MSEGKIGSEMGMLGHMVVMIGGVPFGMRRRSTPLMIQIGGVDRVLGMLAGAMTDDGKRTEDEIAEYVAMLERAMRVVLTSVGGVAVTDDTFDWEALMPVSEALFTEWMASSVSLDPTSRSSARRMEQGRFRRFISFRWLTGKPRTSG